MADEPPWIVIVRPPVMRPNRRYAARIVVRDRSVKLCPHNHQNYARAEQCARWMANASGAKWGVKVGD